MINPILLIQNFIESHSQSNQPFLLALSGGADSLCLFHCLLACQSRLSFFSFHVAHVDHAWRKESQDEALALKQLCAQHAIPFHDKRLNPQMLKGNLEEACRQERYQFFKELSILYGFQGVLIGHQLNDQAETVLKRLLEGAHWSTLSALTPLSYINGMRILRPLLTLSKKEIREWLKSQHILPFEDQTNEDPRFLRARMRQSILPLLSQEFGKEVQGPLTSIGEDIQELKNYFDQKIDPLIARSVHGEWGVYLDLSHDLPASLLEIKYLIRKMCEKEKIVLSKSLLYSAAYFLQTKAANRTLIMGKRKIWVDRQKIFISRFPLLPFSEQLSLIPGTYQLKNWKVEVQTIKDPALIPITSWQNGWNGQWSVVLPAGNYHLGPVSPSAIYRFKNQTLSKWWTDRKIPAFFRSIIPVVWKEGSVYHEFLTGYLLDRLDCHQNWLAVKLYLYI